MEELIVTLVNQQTLGLIPIINVFVLILLNTMMMVFLQIVKHAILLALAVRGHSIQIVKPVQTVIIWITRIPA